jgi:lia operon protein LiaF
MDQRNRNTAFVLIAAGLFILVDHYVGFFTIAALALIVLGIYKVRMSADKSGYVLLGIGVVIFFSGHFTFVLSIVLISLGLFYMQSKKAHTDDGYVQKQNLIESVKLDKESWVLKSSGMWNIIGEIYMDLSLAIPEQKETTLLLQGVLGDVDIIVPEDMGVSVSASVTVGQIDVVKEKESGVLNKIVWQSPNYETSDHKVKLIVSYIVGDIDIKIV